MSLVIKLEKCRGVGMVLLEVKVVDLWLRGGVPAVLAHVHLRSPLFVVVLVSHSVNFEAVTLQ